MGVFRGKVHHVGLEGAEQRREGHVDGEGAVGLVPVPLLVDVEDFGVGVEAEAVLARVLLVLRHLENQGNKARASYRENIVELVFRLLFEPF